MIGIKQEKLPRGSCRRIPAGGRGGSTVGTGKKTVHIRAGALMLALLFLLPACLTARAEMGTGLSDVTLMLAQNAVDSFNLRDAEGKPLQPRTAPEAKGRGIPDAAGEEPDYRGIIGYAALQTGWEVSRFNTFTTTPWILPVYGEDWKEKRNEMIRHKTPVLVVDQFIWEGKGHKYTGYLYVVRLDSMKEAWIDVSQFVTVPYWTLEATEAVKYGYCIAVYRDKSRYEPMDRKAHRGTVPDGTRVLLCYSNPPKFRSPDKEHNPLLGIVFRSKKESESHFRTFLFFNPEDLNLIY